MARAKFEKRTFHNNQTGEDVKYDAYVIYSTIDGVYTELRLTGLSQAEKFAFQHILTGNDETPTVESRSATAEEKNDFLNTYKASNDEDDEALI